MKIKQNLRKTYNKNYKRLLLIPAILLVLSLGYLFYFYTVTGDFIRKDVSLTGGTTITLFPETEVNLNNLKTTLEGSLPDFTVRELSNFRTGRQEAVIVESSVHSDVLRDVLEDFLGYDLDEGNSNIEFTGSSLSGSFYKQLRISVILSFILMAIVVFLIFRTFIPSLAAVLSAFADIMMTLAFVNLLGIRVSSAGIIAFLMLIGYSVDTDIMLTTRLLKRRGRERSLTQAFKTGITMTLTSIAAISVALFITKSFSDVLGQILTIILIGLVFDILNTWITNASILKWYLERKEARL
ncbi:protein translocase subunit SecF [Candidatus Pacearchaeota archaeon]|nr:protein translocase subunit SecF [Candidatus Pacearchaeota archaeon]